jgi:hypothetical protein
LHQIALKSRCALFAAGLATLLPLCGCQSGAQSDLVAREMRLQEDKIYALQDYLAEYQQLVRQYRAENEALKRGLQEGGSAGSNRNVAPLAPSRDASPADRRNQGPQLPNVPVPDHTIPPLDDQSSNFEGDDANAGADAGPIRLATYIETQSTPIGEAASAAGPAASPPTRLWLSGETFSNESGGPRLLVDVAPLSDSGRSLSFVGPVSLMVLAPNEAGPPTNLARWDFSPAEARLAADEAPDPHAMRFRLELPPDVRLDWPVELWVRLLHDDGEKLLASVPLDLREPRGFASTPFAPILDQTKPAAPVVVASAVAATDDSPYLAMQFLMNADDGWTIAKPGQPAISAKASRNEGEWRMATEPLPIVVATSPAARPEIVAPTAIQAPAESAGNLAPPAWSPDRSGENPTATARRETSARQSPTALSGWSPDR